MEIGATLGRTSRRYTGIGQGREMAENPTAVEMTMVGGEIVHES